MSRAPRHRMLIWLLCLAAALVLLAPAGAQAAAATGGPMGGVVAPSAAAVPQARGAILPADTLENFDGDSSTACGDCTPPLIYGDGPVDHSVNTQVIEWTPSGYSFPAGYITAIEKFLNDLSASSDASSNDAAVTRQYLDYGGGALTSGSTPITNSSALVDTTAYPTTGGCTVSGTTVCLTGSQIIDELAAYVQAHSLTTGLDRSYIVLLPPDVDSCWDASNSECEDQAFCAYHSYFETGEIPDTAYTLVPYTDSSYSNAAGVCYMNNGPSIYTNAESGAFTNLMHETLETVTDPVPGLGYVDDNGNEVADECAWMWGSTQSATGGGNYNQVLNGDQYLVQQMWSNADNSCVSGESSEPTAQVDLAEPAAQNTPASFSVSLTNDSYSPTAYSWSYWTPDGDSYVTGVSSAADPQITFPSSGTYDVWVSVTDSNGDVVVGSDSVSVSASSPPSASFTAPSSATAGSAVSFQSTSTGGSGNAITSYSWSFGDGGSSTAAAPSHTYASAGTYTVTLTVTQVGGLTASASQQITVSAAASGGGGSGGTSGSGSGSSSGPGSSGSSGSGSSGSGSTATTTQKLASFLRETLQTLPSGARTRSLLLGGGLRLTLSASVSGTLELNWYAGSGHNRTLVASTKVKLSAGHRATALLTLTAAGRRLLRNHKQLQINATGSFSGSSGSSTASTEFTLRRG